MSSDTPPIESAKDIQVRLKPLFGVEPKYYLAGIYSIAVLILLFFFLVWPGMDHPGTQVTFTSTPPGAAVTWKDKHWGTTPVTVFLPEGKASLTLAKPGFTPFVQEFSSGNNLLFSLLFPRTDAVAATLAPLSENSLAERYRTEVGRWALAAPFTSDYRFPPLFTGFATDVRAAGWDEARIKSFLLSLRGAVADPQMYLDYGRALGLWSAEASAPEGMEAQYRLWEPLVGPSQRLALWLLANQSKPVRDRETAEPSDWFQARIGEFQASLILPAVAAAPAPVTLRTGFGTFQGVAAASFLWGAAGNSFPMPTEAPFALPVPVSTSAFWIAEREVTQAEFAAFTAANPKWATSKASAPAEPVASVSWYAAQAYADWLNASGKVPAGKKAVLPDDFQWEAAARATNGASMLNQGVWEWTSSSWYLGQSLVWNDANVGVEADAYARSIKGGIQTAKGSVKPSDRAGWPAAETTPSLGFRLALIGTP